MKAFITAPFHEDGLKIIKNHMNYVYESWRETGELYRDPEDYIKKINDLKADVLIIEGDLIDDEVLNSCDIKIIGVCRDYPDNVDIDVAIKNNVPIFYTPNRNSDAVADMTIALIFSQLRHLIKIDRLLRSGDFFVDTGEDLADLYRWTRGWELSNQTVGIIGLGSIGFRVAKRLFYGFGCKILIHDPYVDDSKIKQINGKKVDLDTLMKKSDIITVHLKVNEETVDLIGKKEIDLMKHSAFFINTSRAAVIDEDALFEALKNKRIAGAGLDVFGIEPVDSDNIFLKLDNVTVTPHSGGSTFDSEYNQSMMIANDIDSYLKNKKPKYLFNPEILKK
jgi:D-3-phosphoglycerate dehydrogenase